MGGVTGLLLELIFVGLTQLASDEAAFLIAPLVVGLNFPALGYILQVYRAATLSGAGPLPEWENWPALFRGGLAGFAIGLGYGMIPLLLLLWGLGLLVEGGVRLFLGMVLMVLGVLAAMFMLFFLPMGLARYLGQRRLEVAFHPGSLWDGIHPILAEYVATYLLSVGSYILGSLIAAIPYFGALAWPFLWFYLMLVQARLFGEVCSKTASTP
jgi:hypothetical protein